MSRKLTTHKQLAVPHLSIASRALDLEAETARLLPHQQPRCPHRRRFLKQLLQRVDADFALELQQQVPILCDQESHKGLPSELHARMLRFSFLTKAYVMSDIGNECRTAVGGRAVKSPRSRPQKTTGTCFSKP